MENENENLPDPLEEAKSIPGDKSSKSNSNAYYKFKPKPSFLEIEPTMKQMLPLDKDLDSKLDRTILEPQNKDLQDALLTIKAKKKYMEETLKLSEEHFNDFCSFLLGNYSTVEAGKGINKHYKKGYLHNKEVQDFINSLIYTRAYFNKKVWEINFNQPKTLHETYIWYKYFIQPRKDIDQHDYNILWDPKFQDKLESDKSGLYDERIKNRNEKNIKNNTETNKEKRHIIEGPNKFSGFSFVNMIQSGINKNSIKKPSFDFVTYSNFNLSFLFSGSETKDEIDDIFYNLISKNEFQKLQKKTKAIETEKKNNLEIKTKDLNDKINQTTKTKEEIDKNLEEAKKEIDTLKEKLKTSENKQENKEEINEITNLKNKLKEKEEQHDLYIKKIEEIDNLNTKLIYEFEKEQKESDALIKQLQNNLKVFEVKMVAKSPTLTGIEDFIEQIRIDAESNSYHSVIEKQTIEDISEKVNEYKNKHDELEKIEKKLDQTIGKKELEDNNILYLTQKLDKTILTEKEILKDLEKINLESAQEKIEIQSEKNIPSTTLTQSFILSTPIKKSNKEEIPSTQGFEITPIRGLTDEDVPSNQGFEEITPTKKSTKEELIKIKESKTNELYQIAIEKNKILLELQEKQKNVTKYVNSIRKVKNQKEKIHSEVNEYKENINRLLSLPIAEKYMVPVQVEDDKDHSILNNINNIVNKFPKKVVNLNEKNINEIVYTVAFKNWNLDNSSKQVSFYLTAGLLKSKLNGEIENTKKIETYYKDLVTSLQFYKTLYYNDSKKFNEQSKLEKDKFIEKIKDISKLQTDDMVEKKISIIEEEVKTLRKTNDQIKKIINEKEEVIAKKIKELETEENKITSPTKKKQLHLDVEQKKKEIDYYFENFNTIEKLIDVYQNNLYKINIESETLQKLKQDVSTFTDINLKELNYSKEQNKKIVETIKNLQEFYDEKNKFDDENIEVDKNINSITKKLNETIQNKSNLIKSVDEVNKTINDTKEIFEETSNKFNETVSNLSKISEEESNSNEKKKLEENQKKFEDDLKTLMETITKNTEKVKTLNKQIDNVLELEKTQTKEYNEVKEKKIEIQKKLSILNSKINNSNEVISSKINIVGNLQYLLPELDRFYNKNDQEIITMFENIIQRIKEDSKHIERATQELLENNFMQDKEGINIINLKNKGSYSNEFKKFVKALGYSNDTDRNIYINKLFNLLSNKYMAKLKGQKDSNYNLFQISISKKYHYLVYTENELLANAINQKFFGLKDFIAKHKVSIENLKNSTVILNITNYNDFKQLLEIYKK